MTYILVMIGGIGAFALALFLGCKLIDRLPKLPERDIEKAFKEDPNTISFGHKIKVSEDLSQFSDPMHLSRSSLADYNGIKRKREFIDGKCGWNMKLKNKYGEIFDYEYLVYEEWLRPGKSTGMHRHDIFSCKSPKKTRYEFILTNGGDPKIHYSASNFEKVETDNVEFNSVCDVWIVDPKKNAKAKDDENIFYILTPKMMENLKKIYTIFYNLHIVFKGERVYFIFRSGTPLLDINISEEEMIELFQTTIAVLDLNHPISGEDYYNALELLEKHNHWMFYQQYD